MRLALAAALAFAAAAPAAAEADGPALRELRRHHGKIVVLNFWASWCAPCRSEIPLLVGLHREYGPRGVAVVGASIDEPDLRAEARALARELRVDYHLVYGASTEEMKSLELATAIPATAIFDREGRRAFRLVGELKEGDLRARLDWLLTDRRAAGPSELVLPSGVTPEHFAQHVSGEEDDEHHQEDRGGEGAAEEGGSAVPT